MRKLKEVINSVTTIDMIFIIVVVQLSFMMYMENIKMEMIKEYVPTETRVDSLLITDIRILKSELDSIKTILKDR